MGVGKSGEPGSCPTCITQAHLFRIKKNAAWIDSRWTPRREIAQPPPKSWRQTIGPFSQKMSATERRSRTVHRSDFDAELFVSGRVAQAGGKGILALSDNRIIRFLYENRHSYGSGAKLLRTREPCLLSRRDRPIGQRGTANGQSDACAAPQDGTQSGVDLADLAATRRQGSRRV